MLNFKIFSGFSKRMSGGSYDEAGYRKACLTSKNVYDYLVLCKEEGDVIHKLAGVITKKQRVFNIASDQFECVHTKLSDEIFQKIFPNREKDLKRFEDNNVIIFFKNYELVLRVPNKISLLQYESIKNMVNLMECFEKDFNIKIKNFDADEIMAESKEKISDVEYDDFDEVIVGIPLREELQNEFSEGKRR